MSEGFLLRTRRRALSTWLAVLGGVALSFLLGAGVMFFELTPSKFLARAFLGARAWNERRHALSGAPAPQLPTASLGNIDKPGKTFDGYTLYTWASLSEPGTQAFLVNMRREVVHRWSIPFSKVWPRPPHVQGPVNDALVCFFGCHLYPNGDLLAVFHGEENWVNGYGLVRLDRDSNVIWSYPANIHHDVDVGPDGTIYAIKHEVARAMPRGLEYIPTPCLVDSLVMLSPEGKERGEPIPILEAFRDSPYSPLLASLARPRKEEPPSGATAQRYLDDVRRQDALHTNFVQVLSRERASQFPGFEAGQVLVSLRNLDTIAAIDPKKRAVVWAARGPWKAQHDAQFLDNGHLLIFDNQGAPNGSRVLEYDPQTQAFPWSYAGEKAASFFTSERGMSQRLPNGNTLVVNSEGGEIVEVTPDKEAVWSCSVNRFVCTARRYGPDRLPFLKGGPRARP